MQGLGSSHGHHGEIIQGVFEGNCRTLVRGLVSLPCRAIRSVAKFEAGNVADICVSPPWKTKSREAVARFLEAKNLSGKGGSLRIQSNIDVGYGLGSSTADVIASIRAVAACYHLNISPVETAQLAVSAEKACDSTMFDGEAVLFAQRQGVVIEPLKGNLPKISILSANVASSQPIDTLALPPARYSSEEIEQFRFLRGLLRQAIRSGDPKILAKVATSSALINQRHMPLPYFDEIRRMAESSGSLGIQVAHSGTVIGIMFDPRDPATAKSISSAREALISVGLSPILYS